MELTSEQHLIRLVAEAFAVLTSKQLKTMAASMDLDWNEAYELFEANEKRWEELKEFITAGPKDFSPSPETRVSGELAATIIRYAEVLGDFCRDKDTFWRIYKSQVWGGDLFYIGLCNSFDLWPVDEGTARFYLKG